MNAILPILIAAILVEAVIHAIRPIWIPEERKISKSAVISLVIGIGIALAAGLDLPKLAGLPLNIEVVPEVISGIIISRGSNFVADLFKKINGQSNLELSVGEILEDKDIKN